MVPTITEKKAKALRLLRETPGMTAMAFAVRYFDGPENEWLFTAVSNQGNGACAGKKAWLCAGSLLGKLCKQGLVWQNPYSNPGTFLLSEVGRKALEAHEDAKGRKKIRFEMRCMKAIVSPDWYGEESYLKIEILQSLPGLTLSERFLNFVKFLDERISLIETKVDKHSTFHVYEIELSKDELQELKEFEKWGLSEIIQCVDFGFEEQLRGIYWSFIHAVIIGAQNC